MRFYRTLLFVFLIVKARRLEAGFVIAQRVPFRRFTNHKGMVSIM